MNSHTFIDIGKGMYRVTVRSKLKRSRLARTPGIKIEGARVIFSEWIAPNIKRILNPPEKKVRPEPEQMELFDSNLQNAAKKF